MTRLLGLAGILVLAASLGAAVAGAYAAWAWRYERTRFLVSVIGILGTLAVAGPRLAAMLGVLPAAAGWPGWLRLLPDAALAILFPVLLRTLARQDREARRRADGAPVNTLTSLPNRPGFLALMAPALARCRREGRPAAILALTLADLAGTEARRGPGVAQEALRDLTALLRDTARAADLPGHAAPTVLAAFLPATAADGAATLAARLHAAAQARLPAPEMEGRRMRLAIGVATVGEGSGPAPLDEALDAALAALARAQANGGGTEIAPPPPPRSPAPPCRPRRNAPSLRCGRPSPGQDIAPGPARGRISRGRGARSPQLAATAPIPCFCGHLRPIR